MSQLQLPGLIIANNWLTILFSPFQITISFSLLFEKKGERGEGGGGTGAIARAAGPGMCTSVCSACLPVCLHASLSVCFRLFVSFPLSVSLVFIITFFFFSKLVNKIKLIWRNGGWSKEK